MLQENRRLREKIVTRAGVHLDETWKCPAEERPVLPGHSHRHARAGRSSQRAEDRHTECNQARDVARSGVSDRGWVRPRRAILLAPLDIDEDDEGALREASLGFDWVTSS